MAKKDDGYVRFRCKGCGQRLKIRDSYEGGNVIQCPGCGATVNVPLANLEAIASGTEMAETGQPGRLNVDPDLLLRRLGGKGGESAEPGSVGGPPTLRQAPWSPRAAFGRVQALDQLGASLAKIDQELMGQIQPLYRQQDLSAKDREQQVKQAALLRRKEIRNLVANRLRALSEQARSLQANTERLSRAELDHLERLKLAQEAIGFYSRYVLGLES